MQEHLKSNRSFKMMLNVYKKRKRGIEGDNKKRKKEFKECLKRRRKPKDLTWRGKFKAIVSKQLHRLVNNPFS